MPPGPKFIPTPVERALGAPDPAFAPAPVEEALGAVPGPGPKVPDYGSGRPAAGTTAAAHQAGQEWSEWFPFARSSNIAAARYKLDTEEGFGVWQVTFGGKPHKSGAGVTGIRTYEYGPSGALTEAEFWRWVIQYGAGGSAGIWFDLNVKRTGVPCRPMGSQGA